MKKQQNITVFGALPGRLNHGPVKASLRLKDAGRVDENDLCIAFHGDAPNSASRRLHLRRDNRHLGPDHSVHQRRLAGIRRPDQSGKTGAGILSHPKCSLVQFSQA